MQNKEIDAFRGRACRVGYKNLSIVRQCDSNGQWNGCYLVTGIDPMTKTTVSAVYAVSDFKNALNERCKWRDKK